MKTLEVRLADTKYLFTVESTLLSDEEVRGSRELVQDRGYLVGLQITLIYIIVLLDTLES